MPSHQYSSHSRRQHLPPTPPDERMQYYANTMAGNMPYQQAYHNVMPSRHVDDRSYDYGHQFSQVNHQQHFQQPMAPTMMYQQPAYYNANLVPPPHAPVNHPYYRPMLGPILPPIRGYEMVPHGDARAHHQQPRENAKAKREDKPIGGVSAKLDYEMEDMTDFVAETSQAMYAFLTHPIVCLADIDIAGSVSPNRPTPPGFRKWVHQVLSATRLPSSTILLAFDYLAEHMHNIQTPYPAEAGEMELHRLLTTALILGSKFLDDNTFINKSWAEVSGIEVEILNYMEREWLKEISFHLHRDRATPNGFNAFAARWKQFLHHRSSQSMQANQANMAAAHGQVWIPRHLASPASAVEFSPQGMYNRGAVTTYPTPSFSNYVPYGSRSTNTSPPSAPYTSPTTPEYHGHQNQWNSLNGNVGQPRLSVAVSGPPVVSAVSQATVQAPAFVPANFPPAPMYSSGHGPECFCVPCNRQYMMAPHFGVPQSVAG